ncbi:MAG TPA: SDR family NAD(P)-dependent oxidoreductase [Kofleriaceae bacterium]|nr:SDR family NAD(P)-dependent oxidoreductase [Kofleriaceae bacterium]
MSGPSEPRAPIVPAESAGTAPGRGRLVGRRILVVGAGQNDYGEADPPIGNGRAMALLFAREGARVAVADRDRASAEATCARIGSERGGDGGGGGSGGGNAGQAAVIIADMASAADPAAMVSEAAAALGGLDGVAYNVGIGDRQGLEAATADGWDRVLAVNLRGAMLTARAALPVLADGGAIVFTSSVAGLKPGSRIPAYDASKAALGGLMRHVAFEGAPRSIRANIVAPGLIDTSMGRSASRGRPSRATTAIPLGRQGTGWETAYAALFLLSAEAAYITGQILVVDGGLSALR